MTQKTYGRLDRLLHRLVLQSSIVQDSLLEAERVIFARSYEPIPIEAPVFLTGLPRSGTTILLEILVESGHFASLLYRDMPFVLTPLLWHRFSGRFSGGVKVQERAHGDGIHIGPDAPESFEEVLWQKFWPNHYEEGRTIPWGGGRASKEFDNAFRSHMQKVIAVRRAGGSSAERYLSKNNLNLARLAMTGSPLSEGVFLIPYRDPLETAKSLLRQHRRFTTVQSEDPFARWYMKTIGHREFGLELAPVDFGGWLAEAPSPDGLEFWVTYWCETYEFVLQHAGEADACVFSYEALLENPESSLRRLATRLGIEDDSLVRQHGRIGRPREYGSHTGPSLPQVLVNRMHELQGSLDEAAING